MVPCPPDSSWMAVSASDDRHAQVASMVERRNDEYGVLHASGIHVAGRIVLNLWRLLRSELKLRIYTFESCVAAVLQLRTPHVPAWQLSQWFQGGPAGAHLPLGSSCTLLFSIPAHPLWLYNLPAVQGLRRREHSQADLAVLQTFNPQPVQLAVGLARTPQRFFADLVAACTCSFDLLAINRPASHGQVWLMI